MCPGSDAPLRVLVVDDHPIWRHGVATGLEEAGGAGAGTAASRSDSARSIGESVVWAPGRSGGAARIGRTLAYHRSSGSLFPPSERSMNSLMASAVAATSGTTCG